LAAATGRLFGPHVSSLTAVMFGLLVVDAVAALAIFGWFTYSAARAGARREAA
jgi:hypothetical protein